MKDRLHLSLLWTVVAMTSVGVGISGYLGFHNAADIAGSAKETCIIQSRGLVAQQYLTRAMSDIAQLLTPKPGQKPQPSDQIVGDLRSNASAYAVLESQQPKTRQCGS